MDTWLRGMIQSPSLSLLTLVLVAFLYGAAHSLTPGHGKALVGAYLVGARGTPAHALYLSLTVTATHTAVIYALGLVGMLTSHYFPREELLLAMAVVSALLILAIGTWMFISRFRTLCHRGNGHHDHGHDHHHDDDHDHDHGDSHGHEHEHEHLDGHDHPHGHHDEHDHLHADHDHGNDHSHKHHDEHDHHHADHGHEHPHDHGHGHSHLPPGADGKVTWRSLIGLGISGGLMPCPSALALLLLSMSLNRTGLGLLLVLAFSLGLASVLTVVGLVFVKTGRLLGGGPWVRRGTLSPGGQPCLSSAWASS